MLSDADWQGIRFGDWLNLVGLALTVVGFWLSIGAARRAARAAAAAQSETTRILRQLSVFRSSIDLNKIVISIDNLKTINRLHPSPEVLLFLYSDLAKSVSAHCGNPILSDTDRSYFDETLSEIRDTESTLEAAGNKTNEIDWIGINQRLIARLDRISQIASDLERRQQEMG